MTRITSKAQSRFLSRFRFETEPRDEDARKLLDLLGSATWDFAPQGREVIVFHIDPELRISWANYSHNGDDLVGAPILEVCQSPELVAEALEAAAEDLEPASFDCLGEFGAWRTRVSPMLARGALVGYRLEGLPVTGPIPVTY